MSKNLKGKTAFIVAILVIFVYGIFGLPHGVSGTALKDALLENGYGELGRNFKVVYGVKF